MAAITAVNAIKRQHPSAFPGKAQIKESHGAFPDVLPSCCFLTMATRCLPSDWVLLGEVSTLGLKR